MTTTTATISAGETANSGDELQLVSFEVAGAILALEISAIQEINRKMQLTAVPHAPPFVRGVTNLRGEVVSILDMHHILGKETRDDLPSDRNLIVNLGDARFGLRVDKVSDIMTVQSAELTVPPSNVQGIPKKLIRGVHQATDRLVLVIDLEQLMEICFVDEAA